MKNIIVTGGSGKAGHAAIQELLDHGYNVLNVDIAPSTTPICPFLKVDLTDLGQTIDALQILPGVDDWGMRKPVGKADGVVHMAAIRAPGIVTEDETFRINMLSCFNVFSAATRLGLKRVVWASSETPFGIPFQRVKPAYLPVDEAHPLLPESTYALTKVLTEEMARQMHRWNPETSFVGLRIGNIKAPSEYHLFADWQTDPQNRKWNLWSYIDSRDVGLACRLGLEADFTGADHFNVTADDTCQAFPTAELIAAAYADVPVRGTLGEFETLLSNEKARKVLGYVPRHSWRTHV
jgi:nucleoside-diphosphate-sugar epimerase